jgi:negative regulator of flagellin synthesis FlgM
MQVDLSTSLGILNSGREVAGSSGSKLRADPESRAANAAGATTADVAQLSTGSDAIEKLKAQLSSVPEVRQPQLDAIKSAMASGTFQISPERIADALLKP